MRSRYPIHSEEILDALRFIYLDCVNLIGYSNASGEVKASGVYDVLDDEVDTLKEEISQDYENGQGYINLMLSKSNVRILKG